MREGIGRKALYAAAFVAVVAAVVTGWLLGGSGRGEVEDPSPSLPEPAARPAVQARAAEKGKSSATGRRSLREDGDEPEEAEEGVVVSEGGEEEGSDDTAADAEEQLVEAFDGLVDKWMEPGEKEVSMEDVSGFSAAFRKVPDSRKEECLQRALNLVPDDNVMLLAGILMDKSQPVELLETVYNDILNRDEDVKKTILMQIYRDRDHPCWADTAWILDATGETPKNE